MSDANLEAYHAFNARRDADNEASFNMKIEAVGGGARAVELLPTDAFAKERGKRVLITRSATPDRDGPWRSTWYDKHGPFSHGGHASMENALAQFSGKWVRGDKWSAPVPEGSAWDWVVGRVM